MVTFMTQTVSADSQPFVARYIDLRHTKRHGERNVKYNNNRVCRQAKLTKSVIASYPPPQLNIKPLILQ
jgi:hypothetical protein